MFAQEFECMSASCRDPPGREILSVSLNRLPTSADRCRTAGGDVGVRPERGRLSSAGRDQTGVGCRAIKGLAASRRTAMVSHFLYTYGTYIHPQAFFFFFLG